MIVVAGESLIDLIPGEDGALVPLPGGGPLNVARALARLRVPCAFLGAVSTDRFGVVLSDALEADGVDVRTVVRTGLPTTLAVAELERDGAAHYRFYADGTSAPSLTEVQAATALRGLSVGALHVGSLGLALQPLGDAVERIVRDAPRDALVMVDPNWRVGAPVQAGPWRARLGRVLKRADVVKVSTGDLEHLAPGVPVDRAARALLSARTRCVLVTDGAGDVLVHTAAGRRVVVPPRVEVVDTVGAGDAFCAGFLAWCADSGASGDALGDPDAMARAATFAALVAARTCERAGAHPPRLAELGDAERRRVGGRIHA